jgi:protein-S-isoprenylcysteine O-methyltransferase
MARKSTSSSVTNSNGHPPRSDTADDAHAKQFVPGTNRLWTNDEFNWDSPRYISKTKAVPDDPTLAPGESRSLSSIGLQAFGLGFMLAFCMSLTTLLLFIEDSLWRLPAFISCLSLFHFLEYWTTAHFNTSEARATSFLLYSNGVAYNAAHSLATVEIIVSSFFNRYQNLFANRYTIALGLLLVTIGQIVRTVAMAQAGTNFNHLPAKTKKDDHVLVTEGVYHWLRHPSYFGFFWWALGTQVLVGNKVCLLGYLVALWRFFNSRIKCECHSLTIEDTTLTVN